MNSVNVLQSRDYGYKLMGFNEISSIINNKYCYK